MDDLHDLECMLRSRIPLIIIESHDERRVARLFTQLAISLAKPVMGWSATNGLQRLDVDSVPQRHASAPEQALGQIKATRSPGIYLLMDFHPYLDDAYNVRLLKEIALDYDELGHTLVLVSHQLTVPEELASFSARFTLSLPDSAQLEALIQEEAGHWSTQHRGEKVRTDRRTLNLIIQQLRGLTTTDARRIIRRVIHDDGAINKQDLERTTQARYQLLDNHSALSCEFDTGNFAAVGGLQNLKRWVERRRDVFLKQDAARSIQCGVRLEEYITTAFNPAFQIL